MCPQYTADRNFSMKRSIKIQSHARAQDIVDELYRLGYVNLTDAAVDVSLRNTVIGKRAIHKMVLNTRA